MIYGLYLSGQGADAAAFHQAVLANNLANASTTAFKRDLPVFRAHPPFDVAKLQPQTAPDTIDDQTGGLSVEGTVSDFVQGSFKVTGGDLDVAITGPRPAFLEVGSGKQRFLTRNGQFTLNGDNLLVTADSNALPVLTVDGSPVEVPPGTVQIDIAADGSMYGVRPDNSRLELGQLSLVEPESLVSLIKEGNSLYVNPGKAQPALEAQVRQGVLEESGTDPVSGMVDLIQSSRGFEMNMGLVRIQDEMLAQLLQTIPKR
jgi:flagellar basal body rod protein FlgG